MLLADRRKHKQVIWSDKWAQCVGFLLGCVIDFSAEVSILSVARCLHIYNYIFY
jgi:hypothetical protein